MIIVINGLADNRDRFWVRPLPLCRASFATLNPRASSRCVVGEQTTNASSSSAAAYFAERINYRELYAGDKRKRLIAFEAKYRNALFQVQVTIIAAVSPREELEEYAGVSSMSRVLRHSRLLHAIAPTRLTQRGCIYVRNFGRAVSFSFFLSLFLGIHRD
jgi:hypothetical protein